MTAGPSIWVVGASGTIGSAIAARLRDGGAVVFGSSRSAGAFPVDVTDTASVAAASADIARRSGGIDGLVLSIGVPGFGDFPDIADATWEAVVNTKLLGVVRTIRAVLPGMVARGRGAIVVMTGRGTNPPPRHLPGASVNAALNLIVQGLGARYAADGIRINAVAPGPIASPRLAAMTADAGTIKPAARSGTAEQVADAVAFLLSDAAAYVSGTTLVVDGGGQRSFTEKSPS